MNIQHGAVHSCVSPKQVSNLRHLLAATNGDTFSWPTSIHGIDCGCRFDSYLLRPGEHSSSELLVISLPLCVELPELYI